jgi:hypothetical protein
MPQQMVLPRSESRAALLAPDRSCCARGARGTTPSRAARAGGKRGARRAQRCSCGCLPCLAWLRGREPCEAGKQEGPVWRGPARESGFQSSRAQQALTTGPECLRPTQLSAPRSVSALPRPLCSCRRPQCAMCMQCARVLRCSASVSSAFNTPAWMRVLPLHLARGLCCLCPFTDHRVFSPTQRLCPFLLALPLVDLC